MGFFRRTLARRILPFSAEAAVGGAAKNNRQKSPASVDAKTHCWRVLDLLPIDDPEGPGPGPWGIVPNDGPPIMGRIMGRTMESHCASLVLSIPFCAAISQRLSGVRVAAEGGSVLC